MLTFFGGVILAIVLVAVATLAISNITVLLSTRTNIAQERQAAILEQPDAILVLGASVRPDGTPSDMLRDRLDETIALYEIACTINPNAVPKIIMSGDGEDASYNEPRVMKDYAVAHGIPSEVIFCDRAGFSTYESIYRARVVFGVTTLCVVTQSYHLPRALYAAEGLGMHVIGVASDGGPYANQLEYDIREIPARTKDFFQTLLKCPSTVKGDRVSLDQSGDITNL